jgi:hypothetical protein
LLACDAVKDHAGGGLRHDLERVAAWEFGEVVRRDELELPTSIEELATRLLSICATKWRISCVAVEPDAFVFPFCAATSKPVRRSLRIASRI